MFLLFSSNYYGCLKGDILRLSTSIKKKILILTGSTQIKPIETYSENFEITKEFPEMKTYLIPIPKQFKKLCSEFFCIKTSHDLFVITLTMHQFSIREILTR